MASSLAFLLMAVMANQASAFNLEPRIAIVKTGPKGSYFGYSVAQHQVLLSSHTSSCPVPCSSLVLSSYHPHPFFETSVCVFIHIAVLALVALSASLPSVIGSRPYYPPALDQTAGKNASTLIRIQTMLGQTKPSNQTDSPTKPSQTIKQSDLMLWPEHLAKLCKLGHNHTYHLIQLNHCIFYCDILLLQSSHILPLRTYQ